MCLWEYHPLKQGLRRIFSDLLGIDTITLRVSSIKTRIKTEVWVSSSLCGTQRVSSIKTRIKTLKNYILGSLSVQTQRVSSIKTRIKTQRTLLYSLMMAALRVSSIKTRIKTVNTFYIDCSNWLREYLPLKQGWSAI